MDPSIRAGLIQAILQMAAQDSEVLHSVLEYTRNARRSVASELVELKERIEKADDSLLEASYNFAVAAKT